MDESINLTVGPSDLRIAEWRSYELDFDKVKSLEDVIAVLRGLQITITIMEPPEDKWAVLMPYLRAKSA